jgi:hypothetical protein
MAIGSGLGSSFGLSTETVYGTYVAPATFLYHESADLQPTDGRVTAPTIKAGGLGPRAAHHVQTTYNASADLKTDLVAKGLGKLFQAIMGGTSTSTSGGSSSYTQVHTLAGDFKSLSLQTGRPLRSGASVVPATVVGAVVTSAEVSCDASDVAKLSVGFDGRKWDNTTALATVSYPTPAPAAYTGLQSTLKIGAHGSEATLAGARSCTWKLARKLDDADYTLDGTGLKAQPVLSDWYDLTGTVSRDYLDKTAVEDLSLTTTPTSLNWSFTGALIGTSIYYKIAFDVPSVVFEPKAQSINGPKELTSDWSWKWYDDDSGVMPSVTIITTDTAI